MFRGSATYKMIVKANRVDSKKHFNVTDIDRKTGICALLVLQIYLSQC